MSQFAGDLTTGKGGALAHMRPCRIEEPPSTAVMNQSPFHVIDGVTYARDFPIDRVILLIAHAYGYQPRENPLD